MLLGMITRLAVNRQDATYLLYAGTDYTKKQSIMSKHSIIIAWQINSVMQCARWHIRSKKFSTSLLHDIFMPKRLSLAKRRS